MWSGKDTDFFHAHQTSRVRRDWCCTRHRGLDRQTLVPIQNWRNLFKLEQSSANTKLDQLHPWASRASIKKHSSPNHGWNSSSSRVCHLTVRLEYAVSKMASKSMYIIMFRKKQALSNLLVNITIGGQFNIKVQLPPLPMKQHCNLAKGGWELI